ncbi:MAG: hypothetical protein ACTJGD_02555 [Mesonia hippocampi]|uniref:hypothetical protein n=1 Tax=Mesonia hippocampi TaxID=1628250 RepID=UPI003F9B5D5C
MKKLSLLLLFSLSLSTIAQEVKLEKEERIHIEQMPEKARLFLSQKSLTENKTKRFYREIDGDKKSYEAKLKIHRKTYSIEFNTLGELEDIEIAIKEREVPKEVLKNIKNQLSERCDRYKIERIQAQYVNTSSTNQQEVLEQALKKNNFSKVNYEIIIKLKTNEETMRCEVLFDSLGNYKYHRKIIDYAHDTHLH